MPRHPSVQMLKEEVVHILNALHDGAMVFEYGAGQSTILFSQWCDQYHSVEEDIGWFVKVQSVLVTDNVEMYYEPETSPYITSIERAAKRAGGFFDFVLVDGRERVRCAEYARAFLKPNGRLWVHDYDRALYRGVESFCRRVRMVKTLGEFALQ